MAQISQKNTSVGAFFEIKLQFFSLQLYQKGTLIQVFSGEHCEIFKNTCSEEHLQTTAAVYLKSNLQVIYKHTSRKRSILGFTKYFLTSSALQTLVPPSLH